MHLLSWAALVSRDKEINVSGSINLHGIYSNVVHPIHDVGTNDLDGFQ